MRRAGHEQVRGAKNCEWQSCSIRWTKSSDSWCISRGWYTYFNGTWCSNLSKLINFYEMRFWRDGCIQTERSQCKHRAIQVLGANWTCDDHVGVAWSKKMHVQRTCIYSNRFLHSFDKMKLTWEYQFSRIFLPLISWVGLAFNLNGNFANWALEMSMGVFKMKKVTPSVHGGVVSEPSYS